MNEEKRLEEIKKMRDAMKIIGKVVNNGDKILAAEIEEHLEEVQQELKLITWGRCQNKNCTIDEWVRLVKRLSHERFNSSIQN